MSMVYGWSRCQADSARSPYGDRNSSSSNSRVEQPGQLVRPGQAEQQAPCLARRGAGRLAEATGRRAAGQPVVSGGAVVLAGRNPAKRLPTAIELVERTLVDHPERECGDHPDYRAHLDRHRLAVRGEQPVVVDAVLVVPQAQAVERVPDGGEVLEELHHRGRCRVAAPTGAARARWPPSPSRRSPSSRSRRTARARRRPAGATGRSGRCCPGRGNRPRTGCCPRRPRGSPTR